MKTPYYNVPNLQKISDLEAEIARLKGEFQKAEEWNKLTEIQVRNLQEIVENQDQLITELADALESWHSYGLDQAHLQLIQRAREATK